MNTTLMLAQISGESLLHALVYLVIWALIMATCWWGLGKIDPPEPWKKVATVILVLITVVVIINILLGLIGKPFIKW